MCAIAGIFGLPSNDTIKRRMLDSMRRRGPDGEGIYVTKNGCLLHTRLAIIDPIGGSQPMTLDYNGRRFAISYNGELYNTEELRRELILLGHIFNGHSDTEVVLHAYAQWNEDALNKFNGIFAFAVWDETKQRLFLARDRIGVKPLFYMLKGASLLFASEIKTILAYPETEAAIDNEGIAQILLLGPGRIPGSGVLRNINELEPGCCATYSDGKFRIKRYWKLFDREHNESFEDTAEHVKYLVTDSIRRQMVSDVPIGTFLSGGLDSSLISAICSEEKTRAGEPLHTFSVDYLDNDKYFKAGKFQPIADANYIRIMQDHIRSKHHWTVLTPDDLLASLKEATIARDLPGMADVDFSLLAFCKEIRKEVKVALSGECADEIFGGYPWYRDPAVRDADGFPWAQSTCQRMSLIHPEHLRGFDAEDYIRSLYSDTLVFSDILPGTTQLETRMKQMVNLNFRWFMQTLLDRKDRMSMYHGLEVRVPFCDYRIAEYLYGVPWIYKDHQSMEKGLLRYAMRGILPESVLFRKKSPYPKTHDPRYLSLVNTELEKLLARADAPVFDIVDRNALQALVKTDYEWPWYGQLMRRPQTIAYFLQINFWLEQYNVRIY